jgi:pyridoxamine 5'-phosphate oxidase
MAEQEFSELRETEAGFDPVALFRGWFEQAIAADPVQPDAVTLATCTPEGAPSARVVLLRGFDERGFVFFTNYQSRKGAELAANPRAALVFYWPDLGRQVRIEGTVEKVSAKESDDYFQARPLGNQVSAWASPQSRPVASREVLEQQMTAYLERYPDGEVPRPEYWGGYRVRPHLIEFWQGRDNRLHDRLRYRLSDQGDWVRDRLAP